MNAKWNFAHTPGFCFVFMSEDIWIRDIRPFSKKSYSWYTQLWCLLLHNPYFFKLMSHFFFHWLLFQVFIIVVFFPYYCYLFPWVKSKGILVSFSLISKPVAVANTIPSLTLTMFSKILQLATSFRISLFHIPFTICRETHCCDLPINFKAFLCKSFF